MTYPVDPNPPVTQPDTTANGGSDFSGGAGRAYVSPDDLDTSDVAHGTTGSRDTTGSSLAVDADGYDGNLDGPRSDTTVTPLSTSATDGRTASGAVEDTSYTGTLDTTKGAYDANPSDDPVYRAPTEMVYVDGTRDTTLTDARRTDVPEDNDPATLPSSYTLSHYDTTGVGTRQGGPVTFTPPGAPQNVHAEAVEGRREIEVTWDAGTAPAGAPVKRWVIEGSTLGTKYAPANARSAHIHEGLVGGQSYRFTVYAETDLGTGYRSAVSNAVTVHMGDIVVDNTFIESEDDTEAAAPGAPTGVTATADAGGAATVAFTAPTEDGGDAITSYTATSAPGGFTASGAASPLTVTGLVAGTDYTFTVTATNVNGTSAASDPSAPVTALA